MSTHHTGDTAGECGETTAHLPHDVFGSFGCPGIQRRETTHGEPLITLQIPALPAACPAGGQAGPFPLAVFAGQVRVICGNPACDHLIGVLEANRGPA